MPPVASAAVEPPLDVVEDAWGEVDPWSDFAEPSGPPSRREVDEQDAYMLALQSRFRRAAEAVAAALVSRLSVEKSRPPRVRRAPLEPEVPPFRRFHRHGVEILHECGGIDLLVWVTTGRT